MCRFAGWWKHTGSITAVARQAILKRNFQRHLYKPRRGGLHHLSKSAGAKVAVHGDRAEELRVIESIKSLQTELQRPPVRERKSSEQGEIEVQKARPIERSSGCRARRAKGILSEQRGIEI